jgi:hypothetical protein
MSAIRQDLSGIEIDWLKTEIFSQNSHFFVYVDKIIEIDIFPILGLQLDP